MQLDMAKYNPVPFFRFHRIQPLPILFFLPLNNNSSNNTDDTSMDGSSASREKKECISAFESIVTNIASIADAYNQALGGGKEEALLKL